MFTVLTLHSLRRNYIWGTFEIDVRSRNNELIISQMVFRGNFGIRNEISLHVKTL